MTDTLPANTDADSLTAVINAASNHTDVAAVLGLAIPIIAIVMGLGLAMLKIWLDFRKKRELFQLHHAERMAAIEKGVDLPALPPEFFQNHKHEPITAETYLRRGLMWALIGVGVTIAMWSSGEREFLYGLVPIGVGLAYLISYSVERSRRQVAKTN